MLVCDKCGTSLSDGSKFCYKCGDPVTRLDIVNEPETKLRIICPKCDTQSLFRVSKTDNELTCPECRLNFVSRVTRIRSKRSRGEKKTGTRTYTIRVINLDGREEVIGFMDANYHEDFELRSKDIAVFSYINQEIKVVQNITVNRYMKIRKLGDCYLATYAYGPQSEEVAILKAWRDEVLLKSSVLTHMVKIYYFISPILIKMFGNHWIFRNITIILVNPIVISIKKRLQR